MIRPLICADRDRMAAAIICVIDQETAHAGGAHFAEGNFLRAGHAPIEAPHRLTKTRQYDDEKKKVEKEGK